MRLFRKKPEAPAMAPETRAPSSVFTSDLLNGSTDGSRADQRHIMHERTFQQPLPLPKEAKGTAMDGVCTGLQAGSLDDGTNPVSDAVFGFFAAQGFIGYQMCAMLAQHWLIDKACAMPAKDAIRNGHRVTFNGGGEVDPEVFDFMREADKRMHLSQNLVDFVHLGRVFGIRVALFVVEGINYELPFNPDGIKPGAYKGISQVDPYWMGPQLTNESLMDPLSMDFYEPTFWIVNGRKVHKSHLCIFRTSNVADLLKPSYRYGGVPVTQRIYERVYCAERTANEAPQLAMSKRMTVMKTDVTGAMSNLDKFMERMNTWVQMMTNFGVKLINADDAIEQFDTNLSEFDNTIMVQYQIVAAAAGVPVTKLLGTTPKGFNATGEYDESSYHEELESLQIDLTRFLDRHYLCLMRSEVGPKFSIKENVTVAWEPLDSPTEKEQAEINLLEAQTDAQLVTSGGIDGFDVRQRLINDPHSGYTGIEEVVPEGPGDRDHEAALNQLMLGDDGTDPNKDMTAVTED